MRWRSASLTACSCALLLAACGGNGRQAPPPPRPPHIPAGVAARLAADANRVAAMQGCAARPVAIAFRADVIGSIARIPARYQEPLTSAANGLVARIPACPQPPEPEPEKKHHGKHKHKKGHD
jgi:hypothetical protein